jgi:hypothetical protein
MNENYNGSRKSLQILRDGKQSTSDGKKIPLQTIYFGGGTPSLAPVETLRSFSILSAVDGPLLLDIG